MRASPEIVRSAIDQKAVAKLVEKIDRAEASYIEIGQSLEELRTIYAKGGLSSDQFEAHCMKTWGWQKVTVYEKIRAAETAVLVRRAVPDLPIPQNMTVALRLRGVGEQSIQLATWKKLAIRNQRVTSKDIDDLLGEDREAKLQAKQDDAAQKAAYAIAKAGGVPAEEAVETFRQAQAETMGVAPKHATEPQRSRSGQGDALARLLEILAKACRLVDEVDCDRDEVIKIIKKAISKIQETV